MLTLLFVALLCVHFANCELRFVFSQFRHGAREPVQFKGSIDIFGEAWGNKGELTAAGRRMHFLLGLRNRQVYKDFIDKAKIDGSIYIRSTEYNRTMESVTAQLQGLFPPGTGALIDNNVTLSLAHPFIDDPLGQGWNNNAWAKEYGARTIKDRVETFPIHLFDKNNPLFSFFYTMNVCKPLFTFSSNNQKHPKILNFMKNFKEKYGEKWMKMTGSNNTKPLDSYWYLYGFFDSFISDMYDGRSLEKVKAAGIDLQDFNRTSFEFAELDIFYHFNGGEDAFFSRWTSTMLWPEVIQWMENRIAADNAGDFSYHAYERPRFALFSTHDVTVGAGLTTLNRAFGFKKYYTPFASDIFFELHRNEKNQYHVVVKYQNLTLGTVPFAEFKQKLQGQFFTYEEIAKRCNMEVPEQFLHPAKHGH